MNDLPECRVPRLRKRAGRCYELSFRGILQAHDWVVVHGTCNGPPGVGTIGHAWLERDGMVFCPSADKSFQLHEFIRTHSAVGIARYSFADACAMVGEFRHYGPWHIAA